VEKAHPDVFNLLLQVLDDGRITDSQGRTVDFRNTVLILTSNLGSHLLLEGIGPSGEITEQARAGVEEMLHLAFRPEFLNRLDEIVFYKPLTKADIAKIVELMLGDLNRRLAERQLSCSLTDRAKAYVIEQGYDPVYGARPLRRYLQQHVETLIGKRIVSGEILPGSRLTIDLEGDRLVVVAAPAGAD
ncbi:MAG: AAA domain-containing protein, partial [Clostridiales bacterium]|nr:AAA domain-containing protein [Clostridiales bacterium]